MTDKELQKLILNSEAYKECKVFIKNEAAMIGYVERLWKLFSGNDDDLTVNALISLFTASKYNA